MTNLTNALSLLRNTVDPDAVFLLESGIPFEEESWGADGIHASYASAEAAALAIKDINPLFSTEITPYMIEDRLTPADAIQIDREDDSVGSNDWGNGKWCEVYRGSGRLTGYTTDTPTRMADGSVVGFVWYESENEFEKDFMWQQHDHCHSTPQWDCPHCN